MLVSSQKGPKNTPHKPNRIKGPISSIRLFQNLRVVARKTTQTGRANGSRRSPH